MFEMSGSIIFHLVSVQQEEVQLGAHRDEQGLGQGVAGGEQHVVEQAGAHTLGCRHVLEHFPLEPPRPLEPLVDSSFMLTK